MRSLNDQVIITEMKHHAKTIFFIISQIRFFISHVRMTNDNNLNSKYYYLHTRLD